MKTITKAMLAGAALFALGGYSSAATAAESSERPGDEAPVVVYGKSESRHVPDRKIVKRVEAALDAAPYLYAEHITVTSSDGVVTLAGLVGSASDLHTAVTVSSRVPGVKRVVDDLEIWEYDFGGP